MRGAEGSGDLDGVGDGLGDLERSFAADQLLERLALDVLEHDVWSAAVAVLRGLLAGVDDGDDVRVVEPGDGTRLAAEALELVGVCGDLAVHQLDRYGPLEHGVEGAIDGGHAPAPDLRIEPVAPAEQCPEDGHGPYCARNWLRACTHAVIAGRACLFFYGLDDGLAVRERRARASTSAASAIR